MSIVAGLAERRPRSNFQHSPDRGLLWLRESTCAATYNPRRGVRLKKRLLKDEMAKPESKSNADTSLWVYNPWLDLAVGCGAWSAPLLFVSYVAANSSAVAWSLAFYVLAFFFNYPHYMATIYRAYHTEQDFNKYRIFTVHITLLVALTLVLSHFWYQTLPWIFTLYLCWSPWHYSGQNYGLFMLFARRGGAQPSANVRQALYSAFLLSYLVLLVNFHTGPSNDPLFVSLNIPVKANLPIVALFALGFVGFSGFALWQLIKQTGWKSLAPSLTLFSTQFLWFLLPTALAWSRNLQVPQSRYSTGVLAVMHSAQYLWITSYYARRETHQETRSTWRPHAYFALLIVGGIALFVPGPWLASRLFHGDFTTSFLIFTALVNIHHFILDGAIWKLRDGRIAALLLNSKETLSGKATEAGKRTVAGLRWLIGNSRSAHNFRLTAALLLVTLGVVDQVRYYLSLRSENLADLQRAAMLNSFDSALQTRLGRKEMEAGKTEDAATSWRKALQVNPRDIAARDGLLQFLVKQQRYEEAYAITRQSLQYSPKDINLLVNHGILAQQAGHFEEAEQSWSRAVALDSTQLPALLYLADEAERRGKPAEAIPHYVEFLRKASHVNLQSRPELAGNIVMVVLRLASCQERANQPGDAEQSYALAARISLQTGDKRVESLASTSQAQVAASQNKIGEALRLFQHALQLDKDLNDPRTEAMDWYNYGVFLRTAGFPARLSYACLMKSERLLKPLNAAPELKLVSTAKEDLARKERGVLTLTRPDLALDEALRLHAQ